MRRELQPCGTNAAYQRHRRHGEPVDEACRTAHSTEMSSLKRARKEKIYARERARRQAHAALAHRHPEEFARLYAAALAEELAGGAR